MIMACARRRSYVLFCLILMDSLFSVVSLDATKKTSFLPRTRSESDTTTTSTGATSLGDNRIHTSIRKRINAIKWSTPNAISTKNNHTDPQNDNKDETLSSSSLRITESNDQSFSSSIFLKDSFYKKKEDLTDMVSYSREILTTNGSSSTVSILCRTSAYMVGIQSIHNILLHHNTTVFEVRSSRDISILSLLRS